MFQELTSYIYLLEDKKGSTSNVLSFEPTLAAARKTMDKLVEYEKYTLETDGLQVYTTKSPDGNSVSLYTSELVQEKTISIKRVPSCPEIM